MENLSFKQKMFLSILGLIVVIILITYVFTKENSTIAYFEDEISKNIENTTPVHQEAEINKKIIVHIAGQVEEEGIIEVQEKSRLYEAIDKAGGLTADANLSKINLASILKDGQKIYIPSNEEIEDTQIYNDYENEFSKNNMVNINTATQSELESISGIGPSTALKIINYRNENGGFENIEDIKNVPSIGDSKFESIKDSITVD